MAPEPDRWRTARPVMGTMASLHVADDAPHQVITAAADALFTELERLEQTFSTFRSTSEISRINRGELIIADASPEVIDVLDACTWLAHASGGAFRIEPPDRPGIVDPGGFVKGWATERAARVLHDAGLGAWCLNVGGDIQTSGRPFTDRGWLVAIADPHAPGQVRATIELPTGHAIATSGTAERGRHVWTTGSGHDQLAALTVTGPRLTWADAFATAAFAMGVAGVAWVDRFDGYRAWAITTTGEIAGVECGTEPRGRGCRG